MDDSAYPADVIATDITDDACEQLATVIPLPTPAVNRTEVLHGMDPELVRQVLAGLLQQMQLAEPHDAEGRS